jgi:hypothetical protein
MILLGALLLDVLITSSYGFDMAERWLTVVVILTISVVVVAGVYVICDHDHGCDTDGDMG